MIHILFAIYKHRTPPEWTIAAVRVNSRDFVDRFLVAKTIHEITRTKHKRIEFSFTLDRSGATDSFH